MSWTTAFERTWLAMVHPASAVPNEAFADEFVSWLARNGEVDLARQLRGRWAALGSEDVARLALRRLDGVGAVLRRFA